MHLDEEYPRPIFLEDVKLSKDKTTLKATSFLNVFGLVRKK